MSHDPLTIARFWSKVAVGRPGVCWPWQPRSRHPHGYGVFRLPMHAGTVKAHRFAWEVVNGEIADGMVLRHTCDNPPCCNPSHLVLGTQADNMADMRERGRSCRGERRPGAKLTEVEIIALREAVAGGSTHHDVAALFGVSTASVSLIASGHHWAHVGGPITRKAERTHCKRGHEFSPENLYVTPQGYAKCRSCIRMSQAKYLQRKAS